MNILEADQLSVHYDKNPVLWDVSFCIPQHLMVAIIGPNGAGKSTLLKAALRLVQPFSGTIHFTKQCSIAYVPQRDCIDWDFPISVLEVVLMGGYNQLGYFKRVRSADKKAAGQMLDLLGIKALSHKQIDQLSGGQKQRLFIARALMQDPDILLLDEPFAGIDMATEKMLIELFQKLKTQNKSIFIVHHDLSTLRKYFDWVVMLNTRLVSHGPIEEVVTKDHIKKTFGSSLSLFEEANILSNKQLKGLK